MQNCYTRADSYCPDYHNRKREKKELEELLYEWIARNQFPMSELNLIKQEYYKHNRE